MSKDGAIADYELVSGFELARSKLLAPEFADCLDKPLAFWAVPSDRRLPLALMAKPLGELLGTSLTELFATPGIGRKKIRTMIELLGRASRRDDADLLKAHMVVTNNGRPLEHRHPGEFFPSAESTEICELTWSQWRENIKQHRLGDQPLGRFAPALWHLPRVIWSTPLAAYLDLSLADMRALKTYGEKRVNAVLEIFAALHAILVPVACGSHLAVRIQPRFTWEIEAWIDDQLASNRPPAREEIHRGFVEPLLAQVQIDGGETFRRLMECRLGVSGNETSIRALARSMGLTRARVYQLLEEIHSMMQVRWPDGRQAILRLDARLAQHATGSEALTSFRRSAELFFPDKLAASLPDPADDPSVMP
ncbi:MAG TPA: hypothetical protein VIK18_13575 [Pirellulales bacterium]